MRLLCLTALLPFLTPVLGAAGTKGQASAPACPPRPASPKEQLRLFNAFNDEFLVQYKITEAFTNYVWEDYIQHNPRVPQGRDAAIAFLAPSASYRNSSIVHSGLVDNIGFVHHYEFGNGTQPWLKFIDIYRMNGSCIVEHWDVSASLTLGEINPVPLA